MKLNERHYEMQAKRAGQLQTFATHRLPDLVRSSAWHILNEECGGRLGVLRWAIHSSWVGLKVRAQMFWRLSIRGMDPDSDETWK